MKQQRKNSTISGAPIPATTGQHFGAHTSRRKRHVLITGISLLLVAIGVVVYALFFFGDPSSNASQTSEQKQAVLKSLDGDGVTVVRKQKVQSDFGFSVEVDETEVSARAQVTDPESTENNVRGEEYSDDEVYTPRPYSQIIIEPQRPDDERSYTTDESLRIITNIREGYWANRGLQNSTEAEKLAAIVRQERERFSADEYEVSEPKNVTINGIRFVQMEYTRKFSGIDIDMSIVTRQYYAVQNDRPYFVTIYPVRQDNQAVIRVLERTLESISFGEVDETQLSVIDALDAPQVASAHDELLNDDVTNTPYSIDPDTIFDVVLKNQPAVVRVGTVRCADISLRGGAVLENVCTAGVGSGSIISEDGYIATNAHVVFMDDSSLLSSYFVLADDEDELVDRIATALSQLVQAGRIDDAQRSLFLQLLRTGELDFATAVSGLVQEITPLIIGFENDQTAYAAQLGLEPLGLNVGDNGDRITLKFSDQIKSATLVAYDFDQSFGEGGNSSIAEKQGDSDVAILKMEGSFPAVVLGSVDEITEGDDLTAIGFPGFVDDSFWTTQKTTKPTVTQGSIIEITEESDAKNNILIVTNVPIAKGNSGGPAFSGNGTQVGLNTYSVLPCEDRKCFGDGIARDVKDLIQLAESESIEFDTSSKVNDMWAASQAEYARGYYKGAVRGYSAILADYPAHYLAERMRTLAESKYGSADDISGTIEQKRILILAGSGLGGLVIVSGAIVLAVSLRRRRSQPGNWQPPQSSWQNGTLPPVQPNGGAPHQNMHGSASYHGQPNASTQVPQQTGYPQQYPQPPSSPQQFSQQTPVLQQPWPSSPPVGSADVLQPSQYPAQQFPVQDAPSQSPQPQVIQPNQPNNPQQ